MNDMNLKRTPLYQRHVDLGGKIVPFAGWELPVQYTGVIPEHHAVRQASGLFDVSHMGEVFVTGPEAEKAIDALTCNDVKTLVDGKAQYSAITNEQGGVVDDIIVYRYSPRKYLICVNAANSDKDFQWFLDHNRFDAEFTNKSSLYGQIALQGPKALKILSAAQGFSDIGGLAYFHFTERELFGVDVIVARTGYTGEDGFELFVPWDETVSVWDNLLEIGSAEGLAPAGLGARDSLRLEACLPLHGHELGDDISAYESGLGWIVKLNKGDFVGKEALAEQRANGIPRGLAGFFVDDPGIVRHGDSLLSVEGQAVGQCTSGTKTPTVNRALGLGLVKTDYAKEGTSIVAAVRGKNLRCTVVKRPFYKRATA